MAAKTIHFRLDGYPELEANIRALPDVIQRKVVAPALRAGAKVVMMRARSLAPRASRRLAGGPWKVRALTGRRRNRYVGVQVLVPDRAALSIPQKATGFYPTSQEFGWRPGASRTTYDRGGRVLKRNRAGKLYVTTERTKREARALNRAHLRKVPGKRFMHAALFGARGMVFDAIATEARRRLSAIREREIASALGEVAA